MSGDQSIELSDGRTLSYTTFGTNRAASQHVLFYFHGFPGTHNEGIPVHEAATKRGILVVGITRPGFGDSTAQHDRTLLSFSSDVLHLADHLGVQEFAVLGISGGGPYALACLHSLPAERLRSVTVVSGMWPTSFGLAGMIIQNRMMFNIASWFPTIVQWMVDMELSGPAQDTGNSGRFDTLMDTGFRRWPAEDQEVIFRDGRKLFKILSQSSREAIKHGAGGVACEAHIFSRPWDFDLKDTPIDGRLTVWHGAMDRNVPVAMADKAVSLMPNVEYHRYDNEAHLTLIINYLEDILDSIQGRLKR